MTTFQLSPRRISRFLFILISILLLANLVCVYLKYIVGLPHGFIGTFMFGKESNIPSLYSALSLLVCALLLFIIGNLPTEKIKNNNNYWRILGAVFTFLSIDELLALHEMLTTPTRNVIGENASGWFHYAWVVPYLIIFSFISIFFLRFYFRLPRATKIQFFFAAVIFLGGAVGLETIAGRYDYYELPGESDLLLALMVSVEEFMEMSGVVIFIHALLSYYLVQFPANQVTLSLTLNQDQKVADVSPHVVTPPTPAIGKLNREL